MRRVCVVGGGAAGAAAAVEAAKVGASVTLLERSDALQEATSDWPDLLSASNGSSRRSTLDLNAVEMRLGETVLSVDGSKTIVSQKSRASFDAVVLATGSRSLVSPGTSKPGVFVLDSRESCRAIRTGLESSHDVVVSGEGLMAMKIADKLRDGARAVTLFFDPWPRENSARESMLGSLKMAASDVEVTMIDSRVDRIVGLERVEGVLSSGRVYPCDLLVVIPSQVPNVPRVALGRGAKGGVLVDSSLCSTSPGIYAAGACAEFGLVNPGGSLTTVASGIASGRVAGANAAGRHVRFAQEHHIDVQLFGLRLVSTGLSYVEALLRGIPAGFVTMSYGPAAFCSVTYRKPDGKVLGVEFIGGPGSSSLDLSLTISRGITLTELAYAPLTDSTDISLVAETAREGLRRS